MQNNDILSVLQQNINDKDKKIKIQRKQINDLIKILNKNKTPNNLKTIQQLEMIKNNNNKVKLDPYNILNVSKDYTFSSLKKAYLKKCMTAHPDKGGTEEEFKKVSLSYVVLYKKLKGTEYNDHNNLKNNYKDESNSILDDRENIKLDKDSFNLDKFNKLYEENKRDTIYDNGYGGWFSKNEKMPSQPKFNGKIGNEKFNQEFNKYKKNNKDKSNSIVQYKPKELILCSNSDSIMTLGEDNISDFSGSSNGLGFTDLKNAYTNSTLIDVNSVKVNKNRTIHSVEKSRENIKHVMSNKELQKYNEYIQNEKIKEKQRQDRLQKEDKNILLLYEKLNAKLLK